MEIINMAMSHGKNESFASFKVGSWRWRVQEQFEGKWALVDDWYDEEVIVSDSYEEAFKALADYNNAADAEKEKERQAGVKVLHMVAETIGAELTTSFMGFKDLDDNYRINISRDYYDGIDGKEARVRMSIVKLGKIRETLESEYIYEGFTERMILNRYNKLMSEMND